MTKAKKNINPLSDLKVTNIKEYGTNENKIVVETVASFENFFNYLNTPREERVLRKKDEELVITRINYEFENNPEIQLIFKQTQKIVLDGQEITNKTKTHLLQILNKFPNLFIEVYGDILENSQERGKGLKIT